MKNVIYTLSLILMFLVSTNSLSAQKFGYVNSIQLLSELPEITTADDAILAYQTTLISKGEAMVKTFEANYQLYMQEAQSGTLTAVQSQQKEGALTLEQQQIQQYEYEVQNLIAQKREEMYAPILDKVRKAIEDIGKENGYTMIFDSAVLLYADETQDVGALVKAKLGLK